VSNGTCTLTLNTQNCYTPGHPNFYNPAPGQSLVSTSRTTFRETTAWRFTYALMAGVSYDFTDNLKLDVGYKYLNIGEGTVIDDIGNGLSADHPDLTIHSVRIGLRYQIW